MVELVASCDQVGRLRVTYDVFEDISWEYVAEIESLPEDPEKIRKYIDYASYCSKLYNDRAAYHYYCLVLEYLIIDGKIIDDYKELAKDAYHGLLSICSSDDEYVWDSAPCKAEIYESILGYLENDEAF